MEHLELVTPVALRPPSYESRVEGLTKNMSGRFLPRKLADIVACSPPGTNALDFDPKTDELVQTFMLASENFPRGLLSDKDQNSNRWDLYWARHRALYSTFDLKSYMQFLPGKHLNYLLLINAIKNYFGLDDFAGFSVAKVGSGSGVGLSLFGMMGAEAHAFDISPVALMFSQSIAKEYGSLYDSNEPRVQIQQQDFLTRFDERYQASFDIVYNLGVMEELDVTDQQTLLENMVYLAKPGGLVLVAASNSKSPLYYSTLEREANENRVYDNPLLTPFWSETNYGIDVTALESMALNANLKVLHSDACLLAPSSPSDLINLSPDRLSLYEQFCGLSAVSSGVEGLNDVIKYWAMIEPNTDISERLSLGKYAFVLAQKPGSQSRFQYKG